MDTALDTLLNKLDQGSDDYRPTVFKLPADRSTLRSLLGTEPGIRVHDRIHAQLRELLKSLNPHVRFDEPSLEDAIVKHLAGKELKEYGCWVYYPWSKTLVHLLDAEEFAIVRTDRNRNKITRDEQAVLATKKVGVVGLSVGQSVSLTMALERSFGEIRLADFDTLDLSNLNRIRTSTTHLGMNKAVVTAREIAEIDPYLHVICFTDGLTKENMDAFFTKGGKLDILVEECDSVDIKILARQKAKALRIPVVMDMSDRGCLDVERFDLEPDRPLMHGWIDHLDLEAASRPMTAEEKVPYMLPITGVETLSPRMKASVIELGQTVSTWPQLATSVVLGGALAGDVVRRIMLDEFHASGRWFMDLEVLVADPVAPIEHKAHAAPASDAFAISATRLQELDSILGAAPSGSLDPGQDVIEQVVEAGGLAPSAGNMQPWKFLWRGKRLFLFHDEGRSRSFWDPDHFIAHIALGACVENIVLKAHALGMEVKSTLLPVEHMPQLVGMFEFRAEADAGTEPRVADELAPMIGLRCTNRKFPQQTPLPEGSIARMEALARTMDGCMLHVLEDREELFKLAELCGATERIRAINPIGHREFFEHEVRWTAEEALRTKDGLDMATMELRPVDLAGMQVAADPRAIGLIDKWRTGKGLENISRPVIQASPAAILISYTNDTHAERLRAARAMERVWLSANADGLSVHPIAAPILLTHALQFKMDGLRKHEREELEQIREAFHALWNLNGRHPLFTMRLSTGGQPSMRSYRFDPKDLMLPSL